MKYILTLTLIATLLFAGCSNSSSQPQSETEIIELNDGQKWKVNTEMTPHILEGEKILNDYEGDDYKGLAAQLKEKNNSLIKSCTMDGKSHDELHKWLHPHIQMVKALSNAQDQETADKIIEELRESYKLFNTYFQ